MNVRCSGGYCCVDSMTSVGRSFLDKSAGQRLPSPSTSKASKASKRNEDSSSTEVSTPPPPDSTANQVHRSKKNKRGGKRDSRGPITKERLEEFVKGEIIATQWPPDSEFAFDFAGDPTSKSHATEKAETSGEGHVGAAKTGGTPRLIGPVMVNDSLSKEGSKKKEDKWLLKANNIWYVKPRGSAGMSDALHSAHVGVWGVFDGHGGKQAATYASHALYKYTAEYVAECGVDMDPEVFHVTESASDKGSKLLSQGFFRQINKETNAKTWALQTEYMKRLPAAAHRAFLKADEMARKQFNTGGTTATLVFLCGWQLLVASIGDSQAFLDTGSEVLAVSANHRLEENESERERIVREGGEVASSTVNGKPAGPLRVWPGGLAMSRTIGDADAGDLCLAEADVIQVTVPKDGARLIIGSDGLWDAVHPKTAAHHTREMSASEASHKLLSMAIKKDHLKDDVTVVIVDIMPPGHEEKKVPPGLSLHSAAKHQKNNHASVERLARIWRPLEAEGSLKWIEEDLQRRVEQYESWREVQEEQERLARRQKETKRSVEINQKRSGPTGNPDEVSEIGSKKSLLEELSNLTLLPEDFEDSVEDAGEWETVGSTQGNPKGNKQSDKRNRKIKGMKNGANPQGKKKVQEKNDNNGKENTNEVVSDAPQKKKRYFPRRKGGKTGEKKLS
jgi:serine/threonine protein phosphatase PrpC